MNFARIRTLYRAVLLLCLSAQAGAHEGDRVYPIAYLTDEMVEHIRVDDGSVDEWHELVGEPSLTILDCLGQIQERAIRPVRPRLPNLAGLARRPGSFLYVAFVGSDEAYENDHDYDANFPDNLMHGPTTASCLPSMQTMPVDPGLQDEHGPYPR